jgi:hypothetical protein
MALDMQVSDYMKTPTTPAQRQSLSGRVSLLLLWMLGIPLPVLFLVWMFR